MRKSHSRKVYDKKVWRKEKRRKEILDKFWANASRFMRDKMENITFASMYMPKWEDQPPLTISLLQDKCKEMVDTYPIHFKILKERKKLDTPWSCEFVPDWDLGRLDEYRKR